MLRRSLHGRGNYVGLVARAVYLFLAFYAYREGRAFTLV